nr:ribonuclease H-like domain-containing protein [Tanacetum cinerariifolium]
MATTIEQQVALDEALVPSTQRLRIGLESFREMLHICPRIPGQAFAELPFEEEIMKFIRFLGHAIINKCLTGKSSGYDSLRLSQDIYHTRSIDYAFLIWEDFVHQNTQQYGVMLPIELTNDEIRNTKAYKEYYTCATREAAPKPKASARRKRSGSDTSITPPTATITPTTIVAITPRLTAAAKGKQSANAKSPSDPSKLGGSGTDEGTGSKPGVPDVPSNDSEEELSWNSSDDEDTDAQEKDGDDDEGDERDESDDGEEDDAEDKDGDEWDDDDDDLEIAKTDEQDDAERGRDDDEESESDEEKSSSVSSQFVTSMLNPTSDADRLKSLEANFSEYIQTNPFAEAVSNIPGIVHQYMNQQMTESVNAQLEAEVLTRSSHSLRTSYVVAADLSEMELKKILIEKMEGNKSIQHSDEQRNLYKALVDAYEADKTILDSYRETIILKRRRDDDDDQEEGPSAGSDRGSKRQREGADDQTIVQSSQHPEWFSQPKKPPTLDRVWNKTLPAIQGSTQTWISKLAKQADSHSSFNGLLDTPLDFSNFIMNRIRVDTLTPELLAGPTFELMKGSCTSLIKIEYHLEEVYKVTTDQLDWVNPEGQRYPRNLLQPLPLILDNQCRRVIPFAHFINNDLEYLRGGTSSLKYTTSVTKTKAADYGNIKWIEDLVPRSMWIQEPINYDKHALWGVSHWGRKHQQFYWFAVNRESTLDVYSKRRIIDVMDLKIRRVEDLQLGVESYQKRLNLTKPDTYRSDLKLREAYTVYSNPKGFIYQNKDKKNRLMRIDELHKFSDKTLNDVRNALDDRLKGIRMQYLPQTIWRKAWKGLLEEDCMRETFGCCKGPYESSYAAPIIKEWIITSLHSEFAMTDLGSLNYFLSISAQRSASGLFLSQSKFAEEILERAHMQNCNPCWTPVDTESKLGSDGNPVSDPTLYHSLAGALHYLTFTRPDLSYVVQQAGFPITRRSTSEYCMFFGDNLLSWSAKRQVTLSRSNVEAEYRGVANVVAETAWIRNLLCELHTPLFTATLVYCDNVSVVYMSANPVQHQRTKHIEIDIYFVRDFVASGQVRVLHVPSRIQHVDIFTKGLPTTLFIEFHSSLNV